MEKISIETKRQTDATTANEPQKTRYPDNGAAAENGVICQVTKKLNWKTREPNKQGMTANHRVLTNVLITLTKELNSNTKRPATNQGCVSTKCHELQP